MKLTILDRLLIMGILPAESNFVTLKAVKKLKDKLSFKDEEIKKNKIKTVVNAQGGEQVTWDKKALKITVDIKIVAEERELLIKELEEMDKNEKATANHFDLYEKIKKLHDEIGKKG